MLDGAVRRLRLAALGRGPVHAAVAGRDGRGPRARAAAGRARARPLRRAGRQDHAPRRADGEPRHARRRRAPPGPRRRPAPHGRAHGGRGRRPHRRRRRLRRRRALRPRARRPAVLRPRHARLPPRRPLAQAGRRCRSGSHACSRRSCARARARRAPAARSSTRPARSRPPRTPPWSSAFLADEPGFELAATASDMPLWDDPRVPGFSQTLPHRDGTEGFFVARLRRRDAG